MRGRGLGVRSYLLFAMTAVAVLSVGITGLLVHAKVSAEVAQNASQMSAKLQACVVRAVIEGILFSGGIGLLLALPIALRMARPLRRLNDIAGRMARGETATPATGVGGGRELAELGTTLERLAATLRRQDELRRATAADVTHELRDAISRVTCRIEGVQDGVLDRDTVLPRIELDTRRLGRIVDDVQHLVDAQSPGLLVLKHPVDLAAVVSERVAEHAGRFEAASIELRHEVRPTSVNGDPDRLAQIVDNLLSNALRYTEPGGRVSVSLRHDDRAALIEVADTGIGIAHAQLGRVFDRFWRAPGARTRTPEGSGVGLAMVRDLVLAHHGRVDVVSTPGDGSRFRVFVPLDPDAHPDPRAAASPAQTAPAGARDRVMPKNAGRTPDRRARRSAAGPSLHALFTGRARSLLTRRTAR